MKKIILVAFAIIIAVSNIQAQHIFKGIIKDAETYEPLIGATAVVKGTNKGSRSNQLGEIQVKDIPNGSFTLVFSYIGYKKVERDFEFPILDTVKFEVFLTTDSELFEDVIVEATRSNRSIEDIPTRVEVLTEEIDEASTMDPSKIAHLLTHSTGIQVQQTSATSNTANVRIQGLDGRYTQILKDGFPLYGGFSGSLSIMQIPPLDLRQIEYIKGGASTLYGGGAIAGLINLISKEPTKDETLVHLNASQIGAFDVNAFTSARMGDIGFTMLAQRNTHQYFDADNDGFSDMPQLTKYNVNPKLFFYINDDTKLSVGATLTEEVRMGGDTRLMNSQFATAEHFYSEENKVDRVTTQVKFEHKWNENENFTLRNSFNIFDRILRISPNANLEEYRFGGKQVSSFSEIAYSNLFDDNSLIIGVNFYSDNFLEDSLQETKLRKEEYNTLGSFVNYVFDIGDRISIESGLRGDYVMGDRFYTLPRLSALFKWTSQLTTRIGGGMGYRNPTIFNQEAELLGYRNVQSIDRNTTNAEVSYGGNADIGYKIVLGKNAFLNINQMFFFTYLDNPIILSPNGFQSFEFINADGFTQSVGGETFFKLGIYDFTLFMGYTFTDATNHFDSQVSQIPLTPRHSLKGDLLYTIAGILRVGVDYEYKSSQLLTNGKMTEDFWTFGAVVEYTYQNYTFFVNTENLTDVRQTNFGSMVSGPYNTPQFTEVWAPLDGFVINTGFKIRL